MPRRDGPSWRASLTSALNEAAAEVAVDDDRSLTEAEEFFERRCRIRTIDKKVVPFVLNDAQREFMRDRTGRDIVAKARKRGISTLAAADWYRTVCTEPNTAVAMVAHKPDSVDMLWKIVQLLHERDPQAPRLRYSSRKELFLADQNSQFVVLQAGKGSGRAGTFNKLHVSELAHFGDDAIEVLGGMIAAVPPATTGSHIVIESTSNGEGNEFHRRWLASVRGESNYTAHFFPWYEQPEYRLPWKKGASPLTPTERKWVKWYGLDREQIAFYRDKVTDLGADMAQQEYPCTWEESFLASGRKAFDVKVLAAMQREQQRNPIALTEWGRDSYLKVFKEPQRGRRYFGGCDTSEGIVGGDYQDARFYDFETMEEVAALHGHFPLHVFARRLSALVRRYNAHTVIERNNHGHAILEHLINGTEEVLAPLHLIYHHAEYDAATSTTTEKPGWPTTEKTRPIAIAAMQEAIRAAEIIPRDSVWYAEARAFAYNDKGKPEASPGMHDDTVMSSCLALQARKWMDRPDVGVEEGRLH